MGQCFSELAVAVVREVEKAKRMRRNTVRYDAELQVRGAGSESAAPSHASCCLTPDPSALAQALIVQLPESGEDSFALDPAHVRRNDTSARSVNEWTGERLLQDDDIADDVRPADVQPLGNYAVQVCARVEGRGAVAEHWLTATRADHVGGRLQPGGVLRAAGNARSPACRVAWRRRCRGAA